MRRYSAWIRSRRAVPLAGLVALAAAVATLVVVLGGGDGGDGDGDGDGDGELVRHENPLGFSLSHPKGWKVKVEDDLRITVSSPDGKELALASPFIAQRGENAQDCVSGADETLAKVLPDARLVESSTVRSDPDEVAGAFSYRDGGRARVLCSIGDRSGMLFTVAAPSARFKSERDALVAILDSLEFTEPEERSEEGRDEPEIAYERWSDPNENAFSLEVPKGWEVSGGMYRGGAVDVRPAIEVGSPEGDIRIVGGDRDVPPFALPSPTLDAAGFPEGSTYAPYGQQFVVKAYRTGAEFAREHADSGLASGCDIGEPRDREDVAKRFDEIYGRYATGYVTQRLTAGEVEFTCGAEQGYEFAATLVTENPPVGGIWAVTQLYGFRAANRAASTAAATLAHMLETVEIDPEWARAQGETAVGVSEIVSRTGQEISDIVTEGYESRQGSQDEVFRKWSNATLGVTDVQDPDTGETWKVEAGHNWYWRPAGGEGRDVVGTETYDRPDIDFEPLREL